MAEKYVQLTVTGTYASKNNRVYEATGRTVGGANEYMYYDEEYNKDYIYVSGTNVLAANSSFTEAGDSLTGAIGFNATIKRFPQPNLDTFQNDTAVDSVIWMQHQLVTLKGSDEKYSFNITIPEEGPYFIGNKGSGSTLGFISLADSSGQYISEQGSAAYKRAGAVVTMYPGNYRIMLTPNSAGEINVTPDNLRVVKLNKNLCLSNSMWYWLNPSYALDDDNSSEHYIVGLSFGSPASEYLVKSYQNSYETLPTGTMDSLNPLAPSSTTVANRLHTIGEYLYCPTIYKVFFFDKGLLLLRDPGSDDNTIRVSIKDTTSGISNTEALNPYYYYYDIPVQTISISVPAYSSVTVPKVSLINATIQGSLTDDYYDPTKISQVSSIDLCYDGVSIVGGTETEFPEKGYIYFSSPLPDTKDIQFKFAIEFAKKSGGRSLRYYPTGGTVHLRVNGYVYDITLSTRGWTATTSSTDSSRYVYVNSTNYSATKVDGCKLLKNSYITITKATVSAYGSSVLISTDDANGTYYLNKDNTVNGNTYSVKSYIKEINDTTYYVGFQILSGF